MLVEQQLVMLVELENIMIKLNARQRLIAKIVELENTMIKLESLIAKFAELANTMTKRNARQSLIANLIATLDHTSHLTKLYVLFVRKVSGKIKMDR